jgi:hypothetical protein
VRQFSSGDDSRDDSRAARALWAIRWKLGQLLGWDGPDAGLGSRAPAQDTHIRTIGAIPSVQTDIHNGGDAHLDETARPSRM